MKRLLMIVIAALVVPWQVAQARHVAQTTATISLSSPSVAPGTSFTVSGTGFPASNTCNVVLSPNSGGTAYAATVSSDATGKFSLPFYVPPNTNAGAYTVTATCGGVSAHQAIQIATSQIVLSPATAVPGNTVAVTGNGFVPNSQVTMSVTFNLAGGGTKAVTQTFTVLNDGTIPSGVAIPIPANAINSTYNVQFTQNGVVIKTATLVVGQGTGLTLSPATVPSGYSLVTVSGSNFTPGETVSVTGTVNLTAGGTQPLSASATADQNGNFTASLQITSMFAPGSYTITATGASSHRTATATLTISGAPALSISPASAPAGGQIVVKGSNFAPSSTVTVTAQVTLKDGTTQTLTQTGAPDANGTFTVQFTLPANAAAGQVTFQASQATGATTLAANGTLTIVPLTAAITLTPPTAIVGPNGAAVAVAGTGFLAGSPVAVSAQVVVNGSAQAVNVTATPDAAGNFTAVLSIPAGASPGSITVTAAQAAAGYVTTSTLVLQGGTPTPTATSLPTATTLPTATFTPTPTPTPTNTPTATPIPRLGFQYLRTAKHVARPGQINRIAVQALTPRRTIIWAHVNFPNGRHYDWKSRTDVLGRWAQSFVVPAHTTNRYSRRAYVHVQLWRGRETAKTFGSFIIQE